MSWITDAAIWDGLINVTPVAVTINQASGQSDPAYGSSVTFDVVFAEAVTGFATGDVTLSGTAGATTGTVTGSGTTYSVAVTGMTTGGTVIATIAASVCVAVSDGRPNAASTSTDNTVTWVALPTATLWAHYDASVTASITGGSAVSQWNDVSGNGRHLTQSVGGNKPSSGTRSINSLNVVDFDGGDWLVRTAALGFGTGNYTIIGFYGEDANSANYQRFLAMHNGSGNDYDNANSLAITDGANGAPFTAFQGGGGGGSASSAGGSIATPYRTWVVRKGTPSAGTLEVTNITGSPGPYTTGSASANGTVNGGMVLGAGYETSTIGTNPFNGAIGEMLIFASKLSDGDRDAVIAYLVGKWGA